MLYRRLSVITGLVNWTGLLDWTTRLTFDLKTVLSFPVQSENEFMHMRRNKVAARVTQLTLPSSS